MLVAAVLIATSTACSPDMSDTEAQDKVIADYVAAVQAGDRQRLAELAGPRVDATAEIDAKVRAIGGKQWRSVSISWRRGEFPTTATAEIAAADDGGRPVKDTVMLGKVDDSWFVALGAAPDAEQPAATGTP
jgi:hypothetical protein